MMKITKLNQHLFVSLFCGWPIINYVAINFSENLISASIYLVLATLMLASTLISFFLVEVLKLRFMLHTLPLMVIGVFSFGLWLDFVQEVLSITKRAAIISLVLVTLQIILSSIAVGVVTKAKSKKFIVAFGFIILFGPTILNGLMGLTHYTDKTVTVAENATPISRTDFKSTPNIYFVILDMYARQDVLEQTFGFDNSPFVAKLEKRGFTVDENSFSNYPTTPLTISTAFNMDFYSYDKDYSVDLIIGRNPVVSLLRENGYEFIFVDSGGNSQITCGGYEDLCFGLGNIEDDIALLLKMTPLWRLMHSSSVARYFEALYILTDLEQSMIKAVNHIVVSGKPTFVFAHILSPHEPARFNSDCTKIFNLDPGLGTPSMEEYLTDLECLNDQVIRSIDDILARDKTSPIILIQSDHGLRKVDVASNDSLLDLKNLMTFKLPSKCNDLHYSGMTPVNNFRLIFSCLMETEFIPAEDKLLIWDSLERNFFLQVDEDGKVLQKHGSD